jgi:ParB-like nuclease domain
VVAPKGAGPGSAATDLEARETVGIGNAAVSKASPQDPQAVATRRISDIAIGVRHRRDLGDIDSLAASIGALGLLHPVVVRPDGSLIAGERRLRACESLGWTTVPVRVVDMENVTRGELAENVGRQPFLPSEIEAIRRTLEPVEKAAAEQRMKAGTPAKVSQGSGRATDKIGAFAGVSGRTVEKIAQVCAAAEAEPEKYGRLLEDMDRTGRVNGVWRRFSNMRQAERIRAEPPPLPTGPYRVIVADPPWPYEIRREDPSHRATTPYPQMSIAQVCALPVASRAHMDCVVPRRARPCQRAARRCARSHRRGRAMRRPDQPELFAELVETVRTRDQTVGCDDGASATYRTRPPGPGWQILHDRERATVWTRHRPVVWRPVHRPLGGWRR